MILGIIPARYASTRFPAKPLAKIGSKTMIERTYGQVLQAKIDKVIVATDHELIAAEVAKFGGNVMMTSPLHPSGTDRCYEVLANLTQKFEHIINIQGDEPFIKPEQINTLVDMLTPDTEIATLITPIKSAEELQNPNTVKAVINYKHEVVYFSRSPIPHLRGIPIAEWLSHQTYWKHIGIYAYRADILEKITTLEVSPLEKTESLEQLRWLENGMRIRTGMTPFESIGIDTPEDLLRSLSLLNL